MRSFAIWYKEQDDKKIQNQKDKPEVVLNVNLWNKNGKNSNNYCFDFGFKINDIASISTIYLYVPFMIDYENIKDLGKVISNNKLVNAIFNENYKTTDGDPKRLTVNTDKGSFKIYSLEIDNQMDIEHCQSTGDGFGTIIKVKVNDLMLDENDKEYYFRFRIEVESEKTRLVNDEIKGISIFSNSFTNTEVIDFRLNDIRSCSDELKERFNKGNEFNIRAIHYLILRNANDLIIHHGRKLHSRILENDLWGDYIDGYNDNIIAYHIKEKAKKIDDEIQYLSNFTELTRFQYQKTKIRIVIFYIVGIISIGTLGGVVGNILFQWLVKILPMIIPAIENT